MLTGAKPVLGSWAHHFCVVVGCGLDVFYVRPALPPKVVHRHPHPLHVLVSCVQAAHPPAWRTCIHAQPGFQEGI